jgi:hypothetical protein
MSNITASQYAKQAGLRSLAEAVRMTNRSADTLTRWHKDMPDLFRVVIAGCIEIKRQESLKNAPLSFEVGQYVLTVKPALQ